MTDRIRDIDPKTIVGPFVTSGDTGRTGMREELIEQVAIGIYEADDAYDLSWEEQGERNGVRGWYRRVAESGIDRGLVFLTEHADEWLEASRELDEVPWPPAGMSRERADRMMSTTPLFLLAVLSADREDADG